MILTLDIGNTNMKAALFEKMEMKYYWRLSTDRKRSSDELGILLINLLTYNHVDPKSIEGIVMSSVVPQVNFTVEHMCRNYFGMEPLKMIGTPGAVIFGMIYNYIPYMIIPIFNVMSKIEPSLLEAAEDLGSGALSKLRRVILPLSMPGVISGFTMVFVPSVSTFYISQKLGGGKILLIGDAIERQMQTSYNYNLGASLSLVLMVVILVSMVILNRFAGVDDLLI